MEKLDRLKGMLWGLVVGDCLGSPVQFMDKDDHPYVTGMLACAHFHTPAGYWTDDTSMACCIMESLVRRGHYDLSDIGQNFVKWYRKGFWSSLPYAFDVGGATKSAISKIEHGSLANGEEFSQGNGSIMRFAPSYIMNLGRDDETLLFEISDLTHKSKAVQKVVDRMKRVCDSHIQGKRTEITSPYKTRESVNNSGWAVSTLDAALWAFHTTDSFEEGMIAAVNLGGDADSIGAVYGQIAGLYYGLDAIPERWLAGIKDRAKIEKLIDDFLKRCDEIAQMSDLPDCGQKHPLADKSKINYFARKWYWKFQDRYPDIGEVCFSDECFALGFGMDLGKSLKKAYPRHDVQSPAGLREIINSVDDIFFLGTAIFSFWRYQTHWADCCGFSIYEDESREWLMIAFERLIALTSEYKIILSNNDESDGCVLSVSPNRVLIYCGEGRCYGPISANYFFNSKDHFGCHVYQQHLPTERDAEIIQRAVAAKSPEIEPEHALPIEEEFWGHGNLFRSRCCFVERGDGTVVAAHTLNDKIELAGVWAISDRESIFQHLDIGQKIILVREHQNEHDPNAIRVEKYGTCVKLGYIPRKIASALAIELDRGHIHLGYIYDFDDNPAKIVIRIQRREKLPLDNVRSIELEDPQCGGWIEKTKVDFVKKKFFRDLEKEYHPSAHFELQFADTTWEQYKDELNRCNFLNWGHDVEKGKSNDVYRWKLTIRRKDQRSATKISGGNSLPVEWDCFQRFIRNCLNADVVKGRGKFYIKEIEEK